MRPPDPYMKINYILEVPIFVNTNRPRTVILGPRAWAPGPGTPAPNPGHPVPGAWGLWAPDHGLGAPAPEARPRANDANLRHSVAGRAPDASWN